MPTSPSAGIIFPTHAPRNVGQGTSTGEYVLNCSRDDKKTSARFRVDQNGVALLLSSPGNMAMLLPTRVVQSEPAAETSAQKVSRTSAASSVIEFCMQHNDLEFSGEHRGSAATEVIVRCNSWLDSSSKKPSADRNDKESYRQRRQFLPV